MDAMNLIRERLSVLMTQFGLTSLDLRNKSGVSEATVRAILHGEKKNIKIDTIERLCHGLDISMAEFFSLKN